MIIVSDATALINLSRIDRLHLLPAIFKQVAVPEKVWEEVVGKTGLPGSEELRHATWIEVIPIKNQDLFRFFRISLDPGESEALVLAIETNAQFLIIDEFDGRKMAAEKGIRTIGLLGVLGLAKRQKLISQVKPIMDELILSGFRVSKSLYQDVLQTNGES